MKSTQAYQQIHKLSETMDIKWMIKVQHEPYKINQVSSNISNTQHLFPLTNFKQTIEIQNLVATAKINEIASSNLNNIIVNSIARLSNKQEQLFLEIIGILNYYWAYQIIEDSFSEQQLEEDIQKLERIYVESIENENEHPLKIIKLYLILNKYDRLKEGNNIDKFARNVIDNTMKYGDKEPSLHSIISFYNSFNFPSIAIMVGGSSVLLTNYQQANRCA